MGWSREGSVVKCVCSVGREDGELPGAHSGNQCGAGVLRRVSENDQRTLGVKHGDG